jgi:metal-dependent amidase/aminoacylase/carboxypeptidase family protein
VPCHCFDTSRFALHTHAGSTSGGDLADGIQVRADVRALQPSIIADRRHLHAHPELSFEESQTAAYIATRLRSIDGLEFRTGVAPGHGIVAEIKGGAGSGPCIALRADMDALPIQEAPGLPFRSKNDGVMHACGHGR